MKRILLAVFMVLCIAQAASAQTGIRIFGAQQFVLDDNNIANLRVYLSQLTGSMGIDNSGVVNGTFPNTSSLLTLLAGSKTTNLRVDGGSTWGIDVVNTNNSIRTSGVNIFGDLVGNDATTINISGTGNLTLNGIASTALAFPLANVLYINNLNQVRLTPAGVNMVSGSGTLNTVPLWTPTGSQLGNSILTQPNGFSMIVGGTTFGINGLSYVWPSVAATPNQVLTNNGAGVLTWATSSTTIPFADFYAVMPGDNAATIGVGTAVAFPQNGPTSGSIARTGVSTFNLPNVGTYEVNFQVSVTEPGQLMLRINGALVANTVVGRATGTSQLVGVCLITTGAPNSVLEVINPVGNAAALTITPIAGGASAVSAHLVIKQLQ